LVNNSEERMWSFMKKVFNFRSKPEVVLEKKLHKCDSNVAIGSAADQNSDQEESSSKQGSSKQMGVFQPRFDLVDFSSQDDEESVQDTISTADNLEDDNFSLSEIKPDDRARREEIIDTLIELGSVNMNQAQKISNIKSPLARTCSESPRCKGFILVNNHLNFPPILNLSRCFIDYLNYRCHSGEILSRLLARKVCLELEDQDQDFENGETRPALADAEKTAVVFDLLQKRDVFYSFCLGKVVSLEDVDHCVQCHVCFEHSFWSCKSCGATTARLCQLCYPEVSCDFCEPEPEMGNDEFDGNRLIIEEEAEIAENYDQYTWKSLQSLSQLAIDEPGNDTSSDNYSDSSGRPECQQTCQCTQINDDNQCSSTETTSSSSSRSRYSSPQYSFTRDRNDDISSEEYEVEQGFRRGNSWLRDMARR